MEFRIWWSVPLVMAMACGRTQSSSSPKDTAGGAEAAGAAGTDAGGVGGTISEATGGVGGDVGPEANGGATDGGATDGGATDGGAGGEAGDPSTAGAGGMPLFDECAVAPDLVLDAPRATTTLTVVPSLALHLGQGYSSLEPGDGEPLSEGCVTGLETNQALSLGLGGTEVVGGGSASFGALVSDPPRSLWPLPSDEGTSLNAKLAADADRALYGYADTSVGLWAYFMLQEERGPAAPCGEAFVRTVRPRRSMFVAFKLVFSSGAERARFDRCFASEDVLALPNPKPASRFLVAEGTTVEIHVLRAGGRLERTRQLLEETRCSAADLPACADTLAGLEEERDAILATPEPTTPLDELAPDWGVFSFQLGSYSLLPD